MDQMYIITGVTMFVFLLYTFCPIDNKNIVVYPYIAVASVVIRLMAYLFSVACIIRNGSQGRIVTSYVELFIKVREVQASVILLLLIGVLAVSIATRSIKITEDERARVILTSNPYFLNGEERRADFYMKQEMFFIKMNSANIIIAVETILESLMIVLLVVISRLAYVDTYLTSLLMTNSLLFIMFAVIHVYQVRIGFRVRDILIAMCAEVFDE